MRHRDARDRLDRIKSCGAKTDVVSQHLDAPIDRLLQCENAPENLRTGSGALDPNGLAGNLVTGASPHEPEKIKLSLLESDF